jgi:hypothetical protein
MRVNFNYEASSTHTAYLVNQREMGKSLLKGVGTAHFGNLLRRCKP